MKKVSTLILLIVVTLTAVAQLPQEFGRFKRAAKIHQSNPDQELLSKIAKDGAFIFAQSYQLEDSVGKFFGLSGNKEFDSENSLAFKVKNGYILYDKAREPWNYNSRFSKLRKRYTPVLFPSQYAEIKIEARYDSINYNEAEVVTIYPEQIYGMRSVIFFNDGFSVAHNSGMAEGYLVWYILPPGMDLNATTNIDVIVLPEKFDISDDRSKDYFISKPQIEGQVLGGLFITPELSSVGRIDFVINGVIIEDSDEWKLVCPFSNSEELFTSTSPISIKVEDDIDVELTPNDQKK
ncbi:MAG: hypothetical protein K2G85_01545 [Muribaculaceae bacterium]|nr:hypothetical protein [Muribaculaceae bacterium]